MENKFKSTKKGIDGIIGAAKISGKYEAHEMISTKTMYNYIDLGISEIKNIDLLLKLRRKTKSKKVRENKKVLGRSIEERDKSRSKLASSQ